MCDLLEKKNLNNVIHRGFGSIWGDIFYIGTQNGYVEIRDLMAGNFDSHLKIKVMAL